MKITLLLDYPETANPQFGAGMELHGGKVEVVQFGDLFEEQETHDANADIFTPKAWRCDFCGLVVPGGTYHDCKEGTVKAERDRCRKDADARLVLIREAHVHLSNGDHERARLLLEDYLHN